MCCEKDVLRNFTKFTGKLLCQRFFLNKVADLGLQLNLIIKESLAQEFSCEFCEISKNTFFKKHAWAAAFVTNTHTFCVWYTLSPLLNCSWETQRKLLSFSLMVHTHPIFFARLYLEKDTLGLTEKCDNTLRICYYIDLYYMLSHYNFALFPTVEYSIISWNSKYCFWA